MPQHAMNEGPHRRQPRNESLIDGRAISASVAPTVDLRVRLWHRTYFRLLSRAAHAWGTPESAALLPGITAQPPFLTYAACCHESVFFSAVILLAASVPRWN